MADLGSIIEAIKYHPIRRLLKFFIKPNNLTDEVYIDHFKDVIFSNGCIYLKEINQLGDTTLESVVRSQQGLTEVLLSTNLFDDVAPEYKIQGSVVFSISHLAPWARNAIMQANYIELDASFRALRPYVYCVPIAVIQNITLPIGLFLHVSERKELYDNVFRLLRQSGLSETIIQSKCVLSDQGKALISAVGDAGCRHFFCYKHLLTAFGGNRYIMLYTKKLLFTSSPDEFVQKFIDLYPIVSGLVIVGAIPQDLFEKFHKLFPIDPEPLTWDSIGNQLENLPHPLWLRIHDGINTCSNHSERFNRSCNAATSCVHCFNHRLGEAFRFISTYPSLFVREQDRQIKRKLKIMNQTIERFHVSQFEDCPCDECFWGEYYSNLFGIFHFPCIHTAKGVSLAPRNVPMPPSDLFEAVDIRFSKSPGLRDLHNSRRSNEKDKDTSGADTCDIFDEEGCEKTWNNYLKRTASVFLILFPDKFKTWPDGMIAITAKWTVLHHEDESPKNDQTCWTSFVITLIQMFSD
jgi:hypothetical protein